MASCTLLIPLNLFVFGLWGKVFPSNSIWMLTQTLPTCYSFCLLPHLFFKVYIKMPGPACCCYHGNTPLQFVWESISRFQLGLQWCYLGHLALWHPQLEKFINSKPLASNDQLPNYLPKINHITDCSDWRNKCQCWWSSFNFLKLRSKKLWEYLIQKTVLGELTVTFTSMWRLSENIYGLDTLALSNSDSWKITKIKM